MLTVEEIKRCIEGFKPEGFGVEPNSGGFRLSYLGGSYFTLVKKDNDYRELLYPLFLQRVIEGMYKSPGYIIEQNDFNIAIYHNSEKYIESDMELKKVFGYKNGIDQAKEQAIKYILTK